MLIMVDWFHFPQNTLIFNQISRIYLFCLTKLCLTTIYCIFSIRVFFYLRWTHSILRISGKISMQSCFYWYIQRSLILSITVGQHVDFFLEMSDILNRALFCMFVGSGSLETYMGKNWNRKEREGGSNAIFEQRVCSFQPF